MTRALLVSLFAPLFSGCLMVSADVPQVCTTQTVHVDGYAVGAAPPSSSTFTRELALPSVSLDLITHVSIAGGTLSAADDDLTFLSVVKVELLPPDSTLQAITLLDYRRGAAVPRTIDIPATSHELAAYINSSGAVLRLTASGEPKQAGSTLSLELCVDAGVDKTIKLTP